MKLFSMLTAGVLTASLWVVGLSAQAGKGAKGGMMSEMSMMQEHQDISKLVEQLAQGFAAIEAEKDPAMLAQKLAAHGTLLRELQSKIQAHGKMMDEMKAKMAAPAASEEKKPAEEHKH
jgi:hypothetical protein